MLDILASTNEKTAAKVACAAITDPSRLSGQKCAERGACGKHCRTSRRRCARRCNKEHGAWAWARSSQAVEQLTISGLSRHGQRLRAPMAWQDVQTQVEKDLSTIYHEQSPQPTDIGAAMTSPKCQSCGGPTPKGSGCWYRDESCKTCGKRGHLAKVCRSGNAQQSRTNGPNIVRKGAGEGFTGKGKGKGKRRPPETCLCCGKEGHRKGTGRHRKAQEGRLQLQKARHAQPAERSVI